MVPQSRQSVAKAQQTSDQPLLAASWSGVCILSPTYLFCIFIILQDGNRIFFAGCDSKVTCWDLQAQKTSQVAAVSIDSLSVGVLECWSVGVLECWSVGVLEY